MNECVTCGAMVSSRGARCRLCVVRDEIEMSEARLMHFCNLVNAGERQGGAREFARQIDAQFRSIKAALPTQTHNEPREAD